MPENPVAQILWEAAADVERHGVCREPEIFAGETCAAIACWNAASRHAATDFLSYSELVEGVRSLFPAISGELPITHWNDRQPSRAVVAAAMRDAAQWAGPWRLGGSK